MARPMLPPPSKHSKRSSRTKLATPGVETKVSTSPHKVHSNFLPCDGRTCLPDDLAWISFFFCEGTYPGGKKGKYSVIFENYEGGSDQSAKLAGVGLGGGGAEAEAPVTFLPPKTTGTLADFVRLVTDSDMVNCSTCCCCPAVLPMAENILTMCLSCCCFCVTLNGGVVGSFAAAALAALASSCFDTSSSRPSSQVWVWTRRRCPWATSASAPWRTALPR